MVARHLDSIPDLQYRKFTHSTAVDWISYICVIFTSNASEYQECRFAQSHVGS